jgi:hypothetical protein
VNGIERSGEDPAAVSSVVKHQARNLASRVRLPYRLAEEISAHGKRELSKHALPAGELSTGRLLESSPDRTGSQGLVRGGMMIQCGAASNELCGLWMPVIESAHVALTQQFRVPATLAARMRLLDAVRRCDSIALNNPRSFVRDWRRFTCRGVFCFLVVFLPKREVQT